MPLALWGFHILVEYTIGSPTEQVYSVPTLITTWLFIGAAYGGVRFVIDAKGIIDRIHITPRPPADRSD